MSSERLRSVLKDCRPLVNGLLAVEALRSKVREPLVERNAHQAVVNDPAPLISLHPEIVSEQEPSEDIDRVVTSCEGQHHRDA